MCKDMVRLSFFTCFHFLETSTILANYAQSLPYIIRYCATYFRLQNRETLQIQARTRVWGRAAPRYCLQFWGAGQPIQGKYYAGWQDVCDHTQQEFRFTVPGDRRAFADSLWLKEAARQMVVLSALSPKQAALKAWGDVIENNRSAMKLGQDFSVQAGITVRVDRVLSPDQSVLMVVLAQEWGFCFVEKKELRVWGTLPK
jgi:hypothetical protein